MERNIDEKEREKIINFGALNYGITEMSNVLGWSMNDVRLGFNNEESEFYKLYQSGKHKYNYVIDLKLFEMAQGGDLRALEKLEKRKK